MAHVIDFKKVSTAGLESSPVAAALAGLRANEARYFMNKYQHAFATEPAAKTPEVVARVARILQNERKIVLAAKPLETSVFQVENIRFTYVFYEDGLGLNVMWTVDDPSRRAVGLKLSEGMEIPEALGKFKFARQKSAIAGVIRGSFFVIKNEY